MNVTSPLSSITSKVPSQLGSPQPQSDCVFLRLPSGPGRQLWSGSPLNYWKLCSLISPAPWNNNTPPVRAYDFRKPGAARGTPLIEHADLIQWWNSQFQTDPALQGPLPLPNAQLPPVLTIPPSGGQCPVTQLRHTVMYELSLPNSPYSHTKTYVSRYHLPGRAMHPIVMQTQSVLTFIRSFPPPRYQIRPSPSARP
jgi:hypothetical protein